MSHPTPSCHSRVRVLFALAFVLGAALSSAPIAATAFPAAIQDDAAEASAVNILGEDDHGLDGCYRCGIGAADFDEDGRVDLVMAGAFDSVFTPDQGNYSYVDVVRLYRNASERGGPIRFELQQEVPGVGGGGGALVVVADFDGNDRP